MRSYVNFNKSEQMHSVNRKNSILVILAIATTSDCYSATQKTRLPSSYQDQLSAELAVVGPFVGYVSYGCPERDMELVLKDRSNVSIATKPPIKESVWRLRTCGYDLRFTVDCSRWDGFGWRCRAHDWPEPKEEHLGVRLLAPLRFLPNCPVEVSCKKGGRCGEDGFTLRRLWSEGMAARYELSRCGQIVHVEVQCENRKEFGCEAKLAGGFSAMPHG
jgi:hypothetical protein